jgi:hypothetical protein
MMTQAAFLVCRTPGWLAVVSCPPVLFHFEEDMVFPLASSRVYSAMDGTNLDGGSCTWVPFDTHLRRYLSLGSVGVEMLEKRMDWFLVHISDSSKKIFSHFPPISRYFKKKTGLVLDQFVLGSLTVQGVFDIKRGLPLIPQFFMFLAKLSNYSLIPFE